MRWIVAREGTSAGSSVREQLGKVPAARPDQQHRARNLAVVAAMPVTNARDDVIAVLRARIGRACSAGIPL